MNFDRDFGDSSRSGWGDKFRSASNINVSISIPLAVIAGLLGFFVYYQPNNIGASIAAGLAMLVFTLVAEWVTVLVGWIPGFGPWLYTLIVVPFQKWLLGTINIQTSWLTEVIYTIFFVAACLITAIIGIILIVAIIKMFIDMFSR